MLMKIRLDSVYDVLQMIRLQPSHSGCSNYASKDFTWGLYVEAVEDNVKMLYLMDVLAV